ncbi:unnamed protein product [Cyclocybe aegerita]|uniref:Protein-S-isoprenylcysteine O-methyltransferase n=1 Tax=Cyclocybe aegerita TaxID=1973307 RepID=A0A8S0W2K9_CYCAE|nr:unnamed protein product [Cyclocybe aegerita]
MATDSDAQFDRLHERTRQRANMTQNPLETNPVSSANAHRGTIPNTPLGSSTVAFLLGATFGIGLFATLVDEFSRPRWLTYQVSFYLASWAFFHWAEFAVTAGWNLEKCSVDSYLLENGSMYHIAHSGALVEYLITVYLWPSNKTHPYVSQIGVVLVVLGQVLRSAAMIHASTSFSHSVAFQKRDSHTLHDLTEKKAGSDTHLMQDSSIGLLEPTPVLKRKKGRWYAFSDKTTSSTGDMLELKFHSYHDTTL